MPVEDLRTRLATRTQERERAEERLRMIAQASAVLAGSLDYETTVQAVARLALPQVATARIE